MIYLQKSSHKQHIYISERSHMRGGALLYILIAVALLGALTASLIESSDSSASRAQKAYKLASELESQVSFIRAAIQECVLRYPAGDPTVNPGTGVDANYTHPYPLQPLETHFTGSTLGIGSNQYASLIRCPGNPGVDNNHTPIFGGETGRFFPNQQKGFYNWFYYNGQRTTLSVTYEGVKLRIVTDLKDAYVADALEILVDKYDDCETDYIVGDGTNGCSTGRQCFHYWFIRKSAC
jgi:type II secretory pathway pseudopilin PulG